MQFEGTVTSQLPVSEWHDSLGDATIADAILDRLVHNAHRIELRGDSLRRPHRAGAVTGETLAPSAEGPDHAPSSARSAKRATTKAQDERK